MSQGYLSFVAIIMLAVHLLMAGCATPPPSGPVNVSVRPPVPEKPGDLVLDFGGPLPDSVTVYIDGEVVAVAAKGASSLAVDVSMKPWEASRALVIGLEASNLPGLGRVFVVPPSAYGKRSGSIVKSTLKIPLPGEVVFNASRPTNAGFVLAGDQVELAFMPPAIQPEINKQSAFILPVEESFWFTLPVSPTDPPDIQSSTRGTKLVSDYDVWDFLRNETHKAIANGIENIEAASGFYPAVGTFSAAQLSERIPEFRFLGKGSVVTWVPDEETDVRVLAVSRYTSGIWGLHSKIIKVKDLRPVVWLLPANIGPVLDDAFQKSFSELEKEISSEGAQPGMARRISKLMSQVIYEGRPKDGITEWSVVVDPMYPASIPVKIVQIEVGGQIVATLDARQCVSTQTYKAPALGEGMHVARALVEDESGIRTENSLYFYIRAPEPDIREPEYSIGAGISSRELFVSSLKDWATKSVAFILPQKELIGIAQVAPVSSKVLSDMFDFELVSAMRQAGIRVAERNKNWLQVLNSERSEQLQRLKQEYFLEGMINEIDVKQLAKELSELPGGKQDDLSAILGYKLNRARVGWFALGPVVFRQAEIEGWIRLHDIKSYEILSQTSIVSRISDTAIAVSMPLGRDSDVVDSYRDDMLLSPMMPAIILEE
jgi:hypothetical protein